MVSKPYLHQHHLKSTPFYLIVTLPHTHSQSDCICPLLIPPLVHHLISGPRLPFTAAYFGSIVLTLYFSLGVSPFPSVLIPATCQPWCFLPRIPVRVPLLFHASPYRLHSTQLALADNVRVTSCIAPFSPSLRLPLS